VRSSTQHPLLPAECQERYRTDGLWTDETLFDLLLGAAAAAPERPLYLGPEPRTYGEVARAALGLAGRLRRAGVGPGDVVVAPLVNGWPATAMSAAAAGAGAVLAPLPSRSTPAQVGRLAAATKAVALAISGAVLARPDWDSDAIERVRGEAPSLRLLLLADEAAAPDWALRVLERFGDACAGPAAEGLPRVDAGALGLLLSTGGTTGPAKVVMHQHQAAVYAARQYRDTCGLAASDRLLQVGPFGHASGTIFTLYPPILAGAAIVPVAPWSADAFALAAEHHSATWSLLSGTHVHDLVALPAGAEGRLSTLRGISAGSGSDALFAEAERRFGFKIRRMYGLTECLGNSIMPAAAPEASRTMRDGLAFHGTEHVVVAPGTEMPLPAGQAGELLIRGPSLFAGYFGRSDLTAAAVMASGFFRTGDLMTLDEDGFCKYVGRLKDVIRRGGVNIDPLEVERALLTHPAVRDATVVGVPDQRLGERTAAVVVARPGAEPTLAALNAHLAAQEVPLQARPELLFTVAALPLTEYGKHDKNAVRALVQGLAAR
jgi:acyl-CoA synthetase (AMP-forming)/AMP-acid ligase II